MIIQGNWDVLTDIPTIAFYTSRTCQSAACVMKNAEEAIWELRGSPDLFMYESHSRMRLSAC